MQRRRLLATVASGVAATSAGCLGIGATSEGEPDDSTPAQPAIADQPCPPTATDRDSAVCSHTVDTESASVYLAANPRSATLDDGTTTAEITLRLHNESPRDLTFNPHSWTLSWKGDDGWETMEEELVGDGRVTVPPEGTHDWSFVDVVTAIRDEPALDAGLYAAEIGVPDADGDWLACIALVQLTPS